MREESRVLEPTHSLTQDGKFSAETVEQAASNGPESRGFLRTHHDKLTGCTKGGTDRHLRFPGGKMPQGESFGKAGTLCAALQS